MAAMLLSQEYRCASIAQRPTAQTGDKVRTLKFDIFWTHLDVPRTGFFGVLMCNDCARVSASQLTAMEQQSSMGIDDDTPETDLLQEYMP